MYAHQAYMFFPLHTAWFFTQKMAAREIAEEKYAALLQRYSHIDGDSEITGEDLEYLSAAEIKRKVASYNQLVRHAKYGDYEHIKNVEIAKEEVETHKDSFEHDELMKLMFADAVDTENERWEKVKQEFQESIQETDQFWKDFIEEKKKARDRK